MESWPTLTNARRTFKSWFFNFTQSDFHFKATDLADIRSPYLEYFIFSTIKSVQIFSFIGGIIVRPFYTRYRHMKLKPEEVTNNTNKIILTACKRIQGRILLGGICASPLLMAASIYYNGYTTEKLARRCYEIRCDEEILTYDRYACAFGLIGWYWKRFQGAVDGINIAFFYTIFHLKFAKYYMNPIKIDVLQMKKEKVYSSIEEGELETESLLKFVKKKLGIIREDK